MVRPRQELECLRACGVRAFEADGFERELHGLLVRACGDMRSFEAALMLSSLAHVLWAVAQLPLDELLDVEALLPHVQPRHPDPRAVWVESQTALALAFTTAVAHRWPASNVAGLSAIFAWRLAEQLERRTETA